MSRKNTPPVPTIAEQKRDLLRKLREFARVPRSILSLYHARGVDRLRTKAGRAELAVFFRKEFASARDEGAETTLYLKAADAIERQDWPALGRVVHEAERLSWEADSLPDHRGVLRLSRWFEQRTPGAAL